MITTVTFNTAIDQVYEMAHFALGETNRVNTMKQQGGDGFFFREEARDSDDEIWIF